MKILVPIDYSQCSESAFRYAQQYASQFENSQVILYHAVYGFIDMSMPMTAEFIDSFLLAAKVKMQDFAQDHTILQDTTVQIEQITEMGLPAIGIIDVVESQNIDLIIMGTRDKHNIFDKLFGTTSTSILQNSKVPVIFIHQDTSYRHISKTVFGFDLSTDLQQPIKTYSKLNASYLSSTTFLHIGGNTSEVVDRIDGIINDMYDHDNPIYSYDVDMINSDEITTSIIDYSIMKRADMLVLAHAKRGMWHKIFGKSISEAIAHEFQLPVMILPAE